jgi:hypothetical protein
LARLQARVPTWHGNRPVLLLSLLGTPMDQRWSVASAPGPGDVLYVPSAASWPPRSFAASKGSRMVMARCPVMISGLFRVYMDQMVRPKRRFLVRWVSDQLQLSQFTRLARCPANSSSLGWDSQWTGRSVPGTERSLLARFRGTRGLLMWTGFTLLLDVPYLRGRRPSVARALAAGLLFLLEQFPRVPE